jgi:hypothetical protein
MWSSNTAPRDICKGMQLRLFLMHLHIHVYYNSNYNSQVMEKTKMPQWIKKMWYLYIMELLSLNEEWNFVIHK